MSEKILFKTGYSVGIQYLWLAMNILFQPVLIWIIYDDHTKLNEISYFGYILSFFFLFASYVYYSVKYIITDKRVILKSFAHGNISTPITDLKEIACVDSKKGSKGLMSIAFRSKSTKTLHWSFVGGNKEYKIQEIEKHTGIKVKVKHE